MADSKSKSKETYSRGTTKAQSSTNKGIGTGNKGTR